MDRSEYDAEGAPQDEAPAQRSRRGIYLYATGLLLALAVVAFLLIWYTGSLDREPVDIPPVTTLATPKATLPAAVTSLTSTATISPTRSPSPTTVAASTPTTTTVVVVGNTGGKGANLRAQPSTKANVLAGLLDGTRLEVVGADVEAEGYTWKRVKDPKGNTGYIAAEFAVPPR